MTKTAVTQVPLHPLLAERWSPRGLDAGHTLTDDQVTALLEAARWAPSANNVQPWRFLVTHRGTPEFDAVFSTLAGFNTSWAGNASALIAVAAVTHDEQGNPIHYAQYDVGQAVAHLSVQAHAEGLSVHQLGGFDRAAIAEAFPLPETLAFTVVLAVGVHQADAELPDVLAERESAPRVRLGLDELVLNVAPELAISA